MRHATFAGFARETLVRRRTDTSRGGILQGVVDLASAPDWYLTLQGDEPLVYPEIVRLVTQTVTAGISCAIITNGRFRPRYITSLAAAGAPAANRFSRRRRPGGARAQSGLERSEGRLVEGIARARGCAACRCKLR